MQYIARCTGILLCTSLAFLAACDFSKDEPDVQVVQYTGPALEADRIPKWTISEGTEEGELTLTYTQLPIDPDPDSNVDYQGLEIGHTVFLTFSNVTGELPRFEDLWVGVVGGTGRTMVSGEIRLQNWNPDGVVSGMIKGTLKGAISFSTAFWVDPKQS